MRPDRRTASILVGIGAVLALVAFGRPWATVAQVTPGLPTTTSEVSGADLAPGAAVLPLVLLAGLLAVWAVGGWARRVVGVLIVVIGAAVTVTAVRLGVGALDPAALVQTGGQGADPAVTRTPWWLLAAVGGLLALAGGVLVVAYGRHWAGMGARYRRGRADGSGPAGGGETRSAWDLLDDGVDPTLTQEHPGAAPPDPRDGAAHRLHPPDPSSQEPR